MLTKLDILSQKYPYFNTKSATKTTKIMLENFPVYKTVAERYESPTESSKVISGLNV